jgi:hypothetical protein
MSILRKHAALSVNQKRLWPCVFKATYCKIRGSLCMLADSNAPRYGVVRVYSQQCDYVLQDAQAAQATIRTFYKTSKANEIDSTASKAK